MDPYNHAEFQKKPLCQFQENVQTDRRTDRPRAFQPWPQNQKDKKVSQEPILALFAQNLHKLIF